MMSAVRGIRLALNGILLVALSVPAVSAAHEMSTVELGIDTAANRLRVELDLLDLDFVVGVRAAAGPGITAGDVRRAEAGIRDYVKNNLLLDGCAIAGDAGRIGVRRANAAKAIVDFGLDCDASAEYMTIRSSLFDELSGYRTVLRLDSESASQLHVADDGHIRVAIGTRSLFAGFGGFVAEGIRHIFGGFDHLLFLLLLILPLTRQDSFRQCFFAVAGIVTAFTVAHSITLTLSSQEYISLPAKPVEILIAASVVLVAAMNLVGKGGRLAWPVAYVFGLIHGFGFAGAFAELASGSAIRWTDLLAFNIGVETGQLIVIGLALLVLRPLARLHFARPVLVPAGSSIAGLVGALWIVQRL